MRIVPFVYVVLCLVCFAYSQPVSVIRRDQAATSRLQTRHDGAHAGGAQQPTQKIDKCTASITWHAPVKDMQNKVHKRVKDAVKGHSLHEPDEKAITITSGTEHGGQGSKMGKVVCHIGEQVVLSATLELDWDWTG
ncbi:hypothetical protein C8R42DRAFT_729098 [Lentinula raphanica]|nr:hypothetical protein C8R42DRAFT_729098 [Lentinula raphanica]